MAWKFDNNSPIYIQIGEIIKQKIINGEYKLGDKLPAVRDLAIEAGANPNTIQRAYSDLEREGLVKSDRTNGRFVTEDIDIINNLKEELSSKYIKELFSNLNSLGLSVEEIKNLVNNWEEKE